MKTFRRHTGITLLGASVVTVLLSMPSAHAALGLDRTRVVLDGGDKSTSLSVTNGNRTQPYLAQAWVEDAQGNKITDPLIALPPVQRIEPGAKSQVKIQVTSGVSRLPQDKESLYYFNLREIPPKSDKPNTLQIALQTRIKLFYRPTALKFDSSATPWQEKLTLTRQGDSYRINNPTSYYVTIVNASSRVGGDDVKGFMPVMVAPRDSGLIKGSAAELGSTPVLTYINDYGGRPSLIFSCSGGSCHVTSSKAG